MVYLHVTFRVDAHLIEQYNTVFSEKFLPILKELGFQSVGIWTTLIGKAGEYTEIWQFNDIAEYHRMWNSMLADPRVREILLLTGPLVRDEVFKLMTPASFGEI